jgi:hypothetical protein
MFILYSMFIYLIFFKKLFSSKNLFSPNSVLCLSEIFLMPPSVFFYSIRFKCLTLRGFQSIFNSFQKFKIEKAKIRLKKVVF